jgi:hypothetical protein
MVEPTRLSDDEGQPLAAALLRAGQRELPGGRALNRTLTAIGAGSAMLGASQGAAGAGLSVGSKALGLFKWLGAGFLGGAMAFGASEMIESPRETRQINDALPSRAARSAALRATGPAVTSALDEALPVAHETALELGPGAVSRATRGVERAHEVPPTGSESALSPLEPTTVSAADQRGEPGGRRGDVVARSEAARAAAPSHEAVTVVPSKSGAPPVARPSSVGAYEPEAVTSELAAEVALLDEVRQLLAGGRAGASLAALARYRSVVTRPKLDPEARYLELEALVASGDTARARRAATVLIEQYPGGPHAARARGVLGEIE